MIEKLETCPKCGTALAGSFYDFQECTCGWTGTEKLLANIGDCLGLPGGPAFPISIPGVGDNGGWGMSLRDWFAGQAMQAMIHNRTDYKELTHDDQAIAQDCYELADEMLKARKVA